MKPVENVPSASVATFEIQVCGNESVDSDTKQSEQGDFSLGSFPATS